MPDRRASLPSRRSFLRCGAAVLSAPAILSCGALGAAAPSERIVLGCIGMGGHGTNYNLPRLLGAKDARVVAVCDVFDDRRDAARARVDAHYGGKGKGKGCVGVTDFRRVLERSDIDAVMISTPDHWHVPMSILAIRAGKDVICEKPTLTVEEGRVLSAIVRRHKAVFQTSTEDRSIPCYHQMAQTVRNGVIGSVRKVHVRLPAGQRFPHEQPAPVPKGLDWNLWLGPAPEVPYTPNVTERQHWRHVWSYSGGKFSDWGMHQLDTVHWALDMERSGPVEVSGKGTVNPGSMYNTFVSYEVEYRYANGAVVHVRSGGTSLRFEGSDGWIGNKGWRARLEASSADVLAWKPDPDRGDVRLYTNPAGEHRDFLDCVKSRKDPYFPVEVGHRCASLLHIGNISMRLGRKLGWDPKAERFVDDAEADAMRSRPSRSPWSL